MNKTIGSIALALAVSTLSVCAQDTNGVSSAGGPGKGHGGFHLLPPHAAEQLSLTADQLQQLAALEAQVKAQI